LRNAPAPPRTSPPAPPARATGAPAVGRARVWAWLRALGGAAILAFLLWRLGTGPFWHGLRSVSAPAVAAASVLGGVTTACAAWRWRLIARGFGVALPLGVAVAACYRAQFLNSTLPGGVLGDLHRAVRHGREVGSVGRGVRAVVWERGAGQVVQVAAAIVVLLVLPSPVRGRMPLIAVVVVAGGAILAAIVARARPRLGWAEWCGVVAASSVVVTGHLATFLIAARSAGSTAPVSRLVPLALLVLVAMAVPANVGGWGPREGASAWAFAAAGLTASVGLSTAVVYGVLSLAACLPGAAFLVAVRRG
jgi:glycosyltransferase 2 family protein